jgi:hypothetical protein
MSAPRRRSTIVNYATRYEIVMTTRAGKIVLAYTARRTRQMLIAVMLANKDTILAALGEDDDFFWDAKTFCFQSPQGFTCGFSGVTERVASDLLVEIS